MRAYHLFTRANLKHALKRVCYGRARYLTGALCLLQQAEAAAGAQQNEAFEIDQWILDFANLFREQLNIEPDKHLDLTNMGWDKLQAALDSAVQSDQAPAIFDAAADKFQEVSAHGALLLNSCSPKTSHLPCYARAGHCATFVVSDQEMVIWC